MVKLLLFLGEFQGDCTALMVGVGHGHVEIVELLLKAGANVNLKNEVCVHAVVIANYFSFEFAYFLVFSFRLIFVCFCLFRMARLL